MTLLITLMMLSQHGAHPNMPKQGTMPQGQGTGQMEATGMEMTEEQKCQMECSREMRNCVMPLAPRDNAAANDEKKRAEFMAATKKCMSKSQPCLQACQDKAKKEKKDKKGNTTAAKGAAAPQGEPAP